MSEEEERMTLEQQLGKQLLDAVREPSARMLGKANGAVGGMNLLGIIVMLVYQVVLVPTKADIDTLKSNVAEVQMTSVTNDDLDRIIALSQKDIEGIRGDVQELKVELREAVRQEVPDWLNDRLRTLETDVRSLQGKSFREDK